jgi:hypothetical protein
MNKIRFRFAAAFAVLVLAANVLRAQTSFQRITFSLTGEFQTNTFATNADDGSSLTNEHAKMKMIFLGTGNVIKSIAIDLEGTNWSNWSGAILLREVNLTNGNEGIFLRKNSVQTNVSSYFDGTFSNSFTVGVSNAFPALSNNMTGLVSNNINGMTNNANPGFQVVQGNLDMTGPTNFTTNFTKTAGLYFISLNTTNIKFNLLGIATGTITNVQGEGFERTNNSLYIGTAGTFYLNADTNIFDSGTNSPYFYTGPMHGTINVGLPYFSPDQGP